MALFSTPEESAANPPSTWKVAKLLPGLWELTTADGGRLDTFTTKTAAEAATESGFLASLYAKEAAWYDGDPVLDWLPYELLAAR